MAINYKIKNPQTVQEVQQNVEDVAQGGVAKSAISGVETLNLTISGTFTASEVQQIVTKLNEVISKLKT